MRIGRLGLFATSVWLCELPTERPGCLLIAQASLRNIKALAEDNPAVCQRSDRVYQHDLGMAPTNLKMVTYPDYYMIDVAGWNGEIVLVCFVVHFVNSD